MVFAAVLIYRRVGTSGCVQKKAQIGWARFDIRPWINVEAPGTGHRNGTGVDPDLR
jgi:hypothetical protein